MAVNEHNFSIATAEEMPPLSRGIDLNLAAELRKRQADVPSGLKMDLPAQTQQAPVQKPLQMQPPGQAKIPQQQIQSRQQPQMQQRQPQQQIQSRQQPQVQQRQQPQQSPQPRQVPQMQQTQQYERTVKPFQPHMPPVGQQAQQKPQQSQSHQATNFSKLDAQIKKLTEAIQKNIQVKVKMVNSLQDIREEMKTQGTKDSALLKQKDRFITILIVAVIVLFASLVFTSVDRSKKISDLQDQVSGFEDVLNYNNQSQGGTSNIDVQVTPGTKSGQ